MLTPLVTVFVRHSANCKYAGDACRAFRRRRTRCWGMMIEHFIG